MRTAHPTPWPQQHCCHHPATLARTHGTQEAAVLGQRELYHGNLQRAGSRAAFSEPMISEQTSVITWLAVKLVRRVVYGG